MQDTRQIRRLTWFSYLYMAVIIFGAIAWLANRQIAKIHTDIEKINVSWETDGGITFSSMSDGPFIINALILSTSPENAPNIIAQLPKPVIIVESGRVSLTKQEVDKLVWYERHNREQNSAPAKGAPVKALYHKALKTLKTAQAK
jgi:hypothetical protein